MKKFSSWLAGILLASLLIVPAAAQGVGQLGPYQQWGNPSASRGVAQPVNPNQIGVQQTVTPEKYGASCAAANNRVAMQAAITAAINSGAELNLAACLYNVTGQLNIVNPIVISGHGNVSGFNFTPSANADCALNIAANPSSGIVGPVVLRNFRITT